MSYIQVSIYPKDADFTKGVDASDKLGEAYLNEEDAKKYVEYWESMGYKTDTYDWRYDEVFDHD